MSIKYIRGAPVLWLGGLLTMWPRYLIISSQVIVVFDIRTTPRLRVTSVMVMGRFRLSDGEINEGGE